MRAASCFIWGKMRIAALETAPQIALRNCSKEVVNVEVAHSCPTLCDPMDYAVHGILQARILKYVVFPFSGVSFKSRYLPNLQADSLLAEPLGKPKNTGVGSLSLLQQIFLIQESNQGVLHCRQILYQPSYQGISLYS